MEPFCFLAGIAEELPGPWRRGGYFLSQKAVTPLLSDDVTRTFEEYYEELKARGKEHIENL